MNSQTPDEWSTVETRQRHLEALELKFRALEVERDALIDEINRLFEQAGVRKIRGFRIGLPDLPATLRAKSEERGCPISFQVVDRSTNRGTGNKRLVQVVDDHAQWFFRLAEPWMGKMLELDRRRLHFNFRRKQLHAAIGAFRTLHHALTDLEQASHCMEQSTYIDLVEAIPHERNH